METLDRLRRQLVAVEQLQSVVKTMKALAAVSIRQYEQALSSLSEYRRTVEMGLQVLVKSHNVTVTGRHPTRNVSAIVFGSDQGMCGQLNDRIASHAIDAIRTLSAGAHCCLAAVGMRAALRLEDAGFPVEHVLTVPDSAVSIGSRVQDLLLLIQEWRTGRGIERVDLYYPRHLGGASYRSETMRLLPIERDWMEGLADRPWPSRVLPTYTMDWDQLFAVLVREYLFVNLYAAFAESLASENASRLASMQGAERNISDRLVELHERYHGQRQAAITEELLDLVSGFEVLAGEGTRG